MEVYSRTKEREQIQASASCVKLSVNCHMHCCLKWRWEKQSSSFIVIYWRVFLWICFRLNVRNQRNGGDVVTINTRLVREVVLLELSSSYLHILIMFCWYMKHCVWMPWMPNENHRKITRLDTTKDFRSKQQCFVHSVWITFSKSICNISLSFVFRTFSCWERLNEN